MSKARIFIWALRPSLSFTQLIVPDNEWKSLRASKSKIQTYRSRCHKQILVECSYLWNAEIKHSDWLLKVTWPDLTNQIALFQQNVAVLLLSLLMTSTHGTTPSVRTIKVLLFWSLAWHFAKFFHFVLWREGVQQDQVRHQLVGEVLKVHFCLFKFLGENQFWQ